ncbi:MAG: 1-acyl-sn-glycerol-3-phosphate acyltransferase [Spirochaetes bacterium]|nr:1-acyl-sn-glycerol-3-phosphate acyltransferase [Spirochaetota bacterium]
MIVFDIFFSIIAVILILSSSLIFLTLNWWLIFTDKYNRHRIADIPLIQPAAIVYGWILGVRMKVLGKEHVDKRRTTVYICNHQSWLDIIVFIRFSHTIAISKKEVRRIPLVGILTILAGTFFFDRTKSTDRMGIIKQIMIFLKKGHSLCLFPEGTRSRDGSLLKPQLSLLKLCYKMKIPIVPAAIEGTRNVLARKRPYFRFCQKVVLQYTPPIYPEDYENDDDFTQACWERVAETHAELVKKQF